jgi:4-hydroxy-tetrahydrodipicolinate synthase
MNETKAIFEGVAVAVVTPFRAGAVDTEALARLVEHLVGRGIRAIYPCGCTGEATSLRRDERSRVIRAAVEAAAGKASIVAGTGTANTEETIELSREAIGLGADAVMVITPYSCKPTPEGQIAHYCAVADAIDRPIVVYNIPSRTGVLITPETVARLAEHPRIAAIKEASGSLDQASAIRARCDIVILSGDDSLFLPHLAVGARGIVSVAAHVVPAELVALHRAHVAGRTDEAEAIHRRLHPMFRALFLETNRGPVTPALSLWGLAPADIRLPLVGVRPETAGAIAAALEGAGIRLAAPARADA